jgi:hypothetical protein
MQLTTTKFRIYQVRCTCYLSSILYKNITLSEKFQKFNRKIVEKGKFDIPSTHIHGFIKYDVHATCLVYYIFFLDQQFRGDMAILVFLKTMASYNPTSLTPSLFTEVPVLSQESERSCICVLGISQ